MAIETDNEIFASTVKNEITVGPLREYIKVWVNDVIEATSLLNFEY